MPQLDKIGADATQEPQDTESHIDPLADPQIEPEEPLFSAFPSELEIGTDSSNVSLPLGIEGELSLTP
jgi:hypothetical protein